MLLLSLMKRLDKFEKLKKDAFYKKLISKLKGSDLEYIYHFIRSHGDLPIGEWSTLTSRLFLKESDRFKNCNIIQELLFLIR